MLRVVLPLLVAMLGPNGECSSEFINPYSGTDGRLLFPRDHWSVVVIDVRLLESLDWWCIVRARKNAKRIQIGGEGGEINLRISHLLLWLGLATSSSSSPYPRCCISRSVRTS